MSNDPTIFILFSCNQWKEYSSMRLKATSTNIVDIYMAIKTGITKGDMDYDNLTKRAGTKLFMENYLNHSIDLNLLEYGVVLEHDNLAYKKP